MSVRRKYYNWNLNFEVFMNLFLLFVLGISFFNQNIDVNSKVIECHNQLKKSELNKFKTLNYQKYGL